MVIADESVLAEFRRGGCCERCWERSYPGRDPHHIEPRGMGGARRLDVHINLISLGHTHACGCHLGATENRIRKREFFQIVAAREGLPVDAVEQAVRFLLDYDRLTLPGRRAELLAAEPASVRDIVVPILEQWA